MTHLNREDARQGLDPMTLVDPEIRTPLEGFLQMTGGGFVIDETVLPLAREGAAAMMRPWRDDVVVEELTVPGPSGAPDVSVFLVNAGDTTVLRGAVLHIHGGGFIMGSPRNDIAKLQELALTLDCAIASVAYRLAPEACYPTSRDDNYAVLGWLHREGRSRGIDTARIALLGESAGGGHAVQLAMIARERGEFPLVAQVLLYPMLDDRTGSTRQAPPHVGTFMWTSALNKFGWASYLGQEPGGVGVPSGAAPAREARLEGLPQTWIGVGGLDLFVEEDVTFARNLLAAGVPTELLVVPGAIHGFNELAPMSAVAKRFDASWRGALARAVSTTG